MLKKRALECLLIALLGAAYGCEDAADESAESGAEAEEHAEHDDKKSAGGSAAAGKAAAAGKSGSAGAAAKAGAGGAVAAKPAAGGGGTKDAAGSSAPASADDAGPGDSAFVLTSSAFKDGEKLPQKYRCEGAIGGPTGPNPPLSWSGAPAATKSFALVLRDRTFMNYQHWTLYDIPASAAELPEGVPVGAETEPKPAKQAANSGRLTGPGYYGPCGGMNNYEFVLFALDVEALADAGSSGASVESALADHVIGMASLKIVSGPE